MPIIMKGGILKKEFTPGAAIYSLPAILMSTTDKNGKANIMTAA